MGVPWFVANKPGKVDQQCTHQTYLGTWTRYYQDPPVTLDDVLVDTFCAVHRSSQSREKLLATGCRVPFSLSPLVVRIVGATPSFFPCLYHRPPFGSDLGLHDDESGGR